MQSFLSLGHVHLPVDGLFTAVGLMCAMALGLRTAILARVDRDALWDAEALTVLCLFGISRGLFLIENPRMFLRYPLMLLELPSATLTGALLTMIVVAIYLRRKRMPFFNVADAIAPGAALLWAFRNAGRAADGTREGMTTTVPWAVLSSFGHVHPVEIYTAVCGFVASGLLFWILLRSRVTGETLAYGMVLGALVQYMMCFFRLPQVLYSDSLLDGSQMRAIELMVIGTLLLAGRVGVKQQPVVTDIQDAV